MKREVIQTEDGSKTIRIIELEENYHSIHGALQEANHVFMKYGLQEFKDKDELSIFEMGFGTGLNACLTAIQSQVLEVKINYHGLEAFPVSQEELNELEYGTLLGQENKSLYESLHLVKWNEPVKISESFTINKIQDDIQKIELPIEAYDLIYYDAFGPRVQNELWSEEIFQKMFNSLKHGGFLVTYCAKGQVKRNMKSVGFEVEPLPGPPGKREMTRAWKK
jgi:tRNA U34 5-methylaminomethyl-2-thiouridine-forming methyltransferase MnmC